MTDAKDRMLDTCLDEVLGGQTPPDLTSQILQVHQASADQAVPLSVHHVEVREPASTVRRRSADHRSNRRWLNMALTASVLAAVVSVGALAFRLVNRSQDTHRASATTPDRQKNGSKQPIQSHDAPLPITDRRLVQDRNPGPDQPKPHPEPREDQQPDLETQLVTDEARRSMDAEVIALINRELQASWRKHSVQPAGKTDDKTWCVRVFRSLLGREPTTIELSSFVADQAADRRHALVDKLLTSPRYADQLAARLSTVWSNLLVGPAGGRRRGDLADREGLRRYLAESFAANKPLDELARELISATGSGKPKSSDFNGAANFLLAHLDSRGITATAHTARVFLGSRVKCAQCHDHADGHEKIAQREFWQLNAFFRQVDFQRQGRTAQVALVDRDFDGEGDDPEEAEIYFETPEGRLQVAFPELDDKRVPTSGRVEVVNRRQQLADLITRSDRFGQAMVNHFWKTFLSYELSDGHNNLQLADGLADELRARGFDTKSLIRWIALSDAFSLEDATPMADQVDSPEFGGKALFSRFYHRGPKTESVSAGLAAAAKAHADGSVNARMLWYGRFVPQDPSSVSPLDPQLAVPVAATPIIGFDDQQMLRKLSSSGLSFSEKVQHLFWATVTRNPAERELKLADDLRRANDDNVLATLEAVWLVLTNSNEFLVE